jgi:hypothetical protein
MRLDSAFPLEAVTTVLIQQHRKTGQPGLSPLWGLRVRNSNQYWITTEFLRPGSAAINFNTGRTINADRGVWKNWVFHVKYNDAGAGWIKTYLDGTLLHDTGNMVTVPPGTTKLGTMKNGLYPSGCDSNDCAERKIHVDELRFSEGADCPEVADPANW